ncbi:hypothetical protein ES707_08160 [subsurface metagenome]
MARARLPWRRLPSGCLPDVRWSPLSSSSSRYSLTFPPKPSVFTLPKSAIPFQPTAFMREPTTVTSATSLPVLTTLYVRMAAGSPDSSGSWGMKGVYASSWISRGRLSSSKSTYTNGYSPHSLESLSRGRPATWLGSMPWESAKGGTSLLSRTRATVTPSGRFMAMEKKE